MEIESFHDSTKSRLPAPGFLLGRGYVLIASVVFSLYLYGWSTKWTFDPITSFGHPQDFFFTAQANSLLRGHLWVDPTSIGPQTIDECFYSGGRCFGYFGITPSLLRVPILLVFGSTTLGLAPLMIPLAGGIAFASALDLCRRQAARALTGGAAKAFMVTATIALGPGSILVLLADPYSYQEAILWAIAGVLLTVNLFFRWLETTRASYLVSASLTCAFAAGARPTVVLVGPLLAIVVGLKYRRRLFSDKKTVLSIGILLLLPVMLSIGVIYAKFGQVGLPGDAYRNPQGEQRPEVMGICRFSFEPSLRSVPTNLFAYLRPDAVRIKIDQRPPIRFRFNGCVGPNSPTYVWPLKKGPVGELYVEKTTSLSATMPIPVIATIASLWVAFRRKLWNRLVIFLALGTMAVSVAATMAMTSRYLGDFYPLVAVGLAYSVEPLSRLKRPAGTVVVFATALLLGIWSLVVNPSLFFLYAWVYW